MGVTLCRDLCVFSNDGYHSAHIVLFKQWKNNGQIVIKISKKSAHKARRRLRKMIKKYAHQPENAHYIVEAYRSWYGISGCYKNYYITQNYKKLFDKLYKEAF